MSIAAHSSLLLCALSSVLSLAWCLRLLHLEVPSVVDVRDRATLVCKFDLEGDRFFSLKWYKEELEFFRYTTGHVPKIQTFQVDGISLEERESNVSAVTLAPLNYSTSGLYRCEVSAEAPHFKVVYGHANMTVLGLPREDPRIDGLRESYAVGSYVAANCTSSPSYPPAVLDWYINGAKARQRIVDRYGGDGSSDAFGLETRTVALKFRTDSTHFLQGYLSLACSATVLGQTRSTEFRTHLYEQSEEEKSARQVTNRRTRLMPSFCILATFSLAVPSCIRNEISVY